MKRPTLITLFLIILAASFVRSYRWDRPVADWHSWRQADTAAVTRRYVQEGIDLLHPKYDDLSNIPSGLDNPQGYRMVEFPFNNAAIAFLYQLTANFHNLPVHIFSRLVAILYSLGSIIALFFIVNQLVGSRAGLISAAVYALLPFNIFYSTTMLPEVPLVFFTLTSIAFFIHFSQTKSNLSLFFFTAAASLAMLLKPIYIFVGLALLLIFLKNQGLKGFKNPPLYLSALVIVIPLLLWRQWIQQFPEGIPAASWLLNSTGIRFKGAFFRWLFADRIGRLILGYWGLIPFGIGLLRDPNKKSGWFFYSWLIGIGLYLTIFATGNVTHDYYQYFIVPIIAIFVGLGIDQLLFETPSQFNRLAVYALTLTSVAFMFAFSWFHVRDLFNINNPAIVAAGEWVDTNLPTDAKVIAPYMGDTAFLYQTNRQGWPIGTLIGDKINQGATHYVTTTQDDEANDLINRCQLLHQTDQFIVIDITNCDQTPTNANSNL